MRILVLLLCFGFASCSSVKVSDLKSVSPIYETKPIGKAGDAADDPAIWVSKIDKTTRILGTQKKGGIYLYDIKGNINQEILGGLPNNIDLVQDFNWNENEIGTIVVTSDRIDNSIAVYKFDEKNAKLFEKSVNRISTGFAEIYGICIGKIENEVLIAATSKIGEVKIYNIISNNGELKYNLINQFSLGSISEGCVFDQKNNKLFIAQEMVGIWKIEHLKNTQTKKTLIDNVKNGNLVADVEGLTIWENGKASYLIASVQGANKYNIYSIDDENKYLGAFSIIANDKYDAVTGTDGIAAIGRDLGDDLINGIMVAQDDVNSMPNETQNFKIISFDEVLKKLNLPF